MKLDFLKRFFALIICSLLLSASAWAKNSLLDDNRTYLDLASRFDVLEDPTGKLTINEITQSNWDNNFKPLAGELNASFTGSAFWLRFSLQRTSDKAATIWWLETGPALLDNVDFYASPLNQYFTFQQNGDHIPLNSNSIHHRLPVFTIKLTDTQPNIFYLRVQSTSALFLRANISTPQVFSERTNKYSNLIGFFYGILLVMFAYNLVLMISMREKSMLYYQCLSLATLIAAIAVNGHLKLYLPNLPFYFFDTIPLVMVCLIILFNSLFIVEFLNLKSLMPKMENFFRGIQILALLSVLLVLTRTNANISPIIQVIGLLQMFLGIGISLKFALKGYRPGFILTAASTVWIIGASAWSLRILGLIESSWFTDFGFQIGSSIEVVLLALAQADHINLLKQERETAQQALLEMAKKNEHELEEKVNQRTAELGEAVARLQRLDAEKNEFMGIASHDLKNPLTSIIGMSDLLIKLDQEIPYQQRQHYLDRIASNGRRMLHIVTDLLDMNSFESGYTPSNLIPVDLHALLTQTFQQYDNQIKSKQLTLNIQMPIPVIVQADRDTCVQILDNLISNAIKYSPLNEQITVTLQHEDQLGCLAIHNAGPGLSEEDQQHLFEKFSRLSTRPTAGEHSTGLGLSIVKKLTESMQGTISCTSALNQGCTFMLKLPTALE